VTPVWPSSTPPPPAPSLSPPAKGGKQEDEASLTTPLSQLQPQISKVESVASPSLESNYSEDFNSSVTASVPAKLTDDPVAVQEEADEDVTIGATSVASSPESASTSTLSENLTVKTDNLVAKIFTELIRDTGAAFENARANIDQEADQVGDVLGKDFSDVEAVIPTATQAIPEDIKSPAKTQPLLKSPTKPQDLMVTAFDLSEESSTEETVSPPKSPPKSTDNNEEIEASEVTEATEGGVFIDDDFGLSLQQESEQIRRRQILIEKEISRIQEESRLYYEQQQQQQQGGQQTQPTQSQRAIPDKPPPPYTPPTSPAPKLVVKPLPLEPVKYVPSSKAQIQDLTNEMVKEVFQNRVNGIDTPWSDKDSITRGSNEMFVGFMRDAVIEISDEVCSPDTEGQNPVWMSQKPLRKMVMSVPRTEGGLAVSVRTELNILMGFDKRAKKENLIVRWSPQKRRDRVDQILVRELHAEEESWTDFTRDETQVKDALANSLLEILIIDTVTALKKAYDIV